MGGWGVRGVWDHLIGTTGGATRTSAPTLASLCGVPPQRWMEYPGKGRVVQHPGCHAVQTYRGHAVLSTLIR